MRTSFLPSTDAGLLEWSRNLVARLNEGSEAYGISPAQSARLADAQALFAARHAAALDPITRTRGIVSARNDARDALKAVAREVVFIIQAHPGVTDPQKLNLGVTVRKRTRTAVPRPKDAPGITVVAVIGGTVRLRLSDRATGRHHKPTGVRGATVLAFAGDQPPGNLAEWGFVTHTTRTALDAHFGPHVAPGSKVWITAMWHNPRGQRGPVGEAVCAYLGAGMRKAA